MINRNTVIMKTERENLSLNRNEKYWNSLLQERLRPLGKLHYII